MTEEKKEEFHEEYRKEPVRRETVRTGSALWAVVLIGLGLIFLLNNFGFLPWTVWADLWRLWPVFLILLGLQIIFGQTLGGNLLVAVLGLAFVSLILILPLSSTNPALRERIREQAPWLPDYHMMRLDGNEQTERITIKEEQYRGITARRVSADVGVGKLTFSDDESTNFFDLSARYFANFGKPRVRERQDDGLLTIDFDTEGGFAFFMGWQGTTAYEVTLGKPNLPTDLTVEVGTGSAKVNLDRLKVKALEVKVGTGTADVDLSKTSVPSGRVVLDVGTGTIKLRLPKEVGLKVKHDVGTGRLKIGQSTLDGDGTFVSEGYEDAATKLDLDVDVGTGSITIERT